MLADDGGSSSGVSSSVGAAAALGADAGSGVSAPTSTVQSSPSSSLGVSVGSEVFAFVSSSESGTSVFQSNAGIGQATVAVSTSSSNLLLVDLALSDTDDAAYDVADDSLYDAGHEETHVSDLALAAVLSEESDWWDAI